ncbi:netrin-G1-like [Lineus longissimus]|uniref:netrin-G1-like n=1 Tax=Lineus longissimus TaxID=88925 RepID=UPI00315CED9E
MRPDSIIFEKQDESSGGWSPWRYYAENCSESFPSVLYQSGSEAFDSTTVYCEEKFFSTDPDSRDAGFRQQVIFNPNLEYPDSFTNDLTTQRYFLTSAVRFRLLNPADKDPISSYYTIADLKISGQCGCFGHATRCKGPNSAVCVCQHNTTGDNCDQCLPLYNNKPWKLGRDGENNECEVIQLLTLCQVGRTETVT